MIHKALDDAVWLIAGADLDGFAVLLPLAIAVTEVHQRRIPLLCQLYGNGNRVVSVLARLKDTGGCLDSAATYVAIVGFT